MALMMIDLKVVDALNRCNVSDMERVGRELDPSVHNSCQKFGVKVSEVQSALVHTYGIVAFLAVREKNPKQAAALWKDMSDFCDVALTALKGMKERFPHCGTPELCDLALDYKIASDERHTQNLRDSECLDQAIPVGLFPNKN